MLSVTLPQSQIMHTTRNTAKSAPEHSFKWLPRNANCKPLVLRVYNVKQKTLLVNTSYRCAHTQFNVYAFMRRTYTTTVAQRGVLHKI